MNTNKLKTFAQKTRKKLLQQVEERLDYVLNTDSAELREQKAQLEALRKELKRTGRETLIDKVAYTWFNRLVALRYMDVNDYQPFHVRVISPQDGFTEPQILSDAKQGIIPDEFKVDRSKINQLLDGTLESQNPQNEVFKLLLVAACNNLHSIFPFLFEKIQDYTELLIPSDLISEHSVVHDIVEGISAEECQEVEVLGWLYQFYISEKNNELISSKNTYKKDELAPASQLFTPDWIVRYMVDNTLGQLWTEVNPSTSIHKDLEFYIEPSYRDQLSERDNKSVEEITFFEPCVGSGHILSYAFDVFYKMYEEQGYNPSEIPELIITKNLYGVDIDQRATQIASFVLMMKGREKYRRFFRKVVVPNIFYYEDFENDKLFKNATALGSLIKVAPEQHKKIEVSSDSLFGDQQQKLKELYKLLGRRYDVVVTNPPYISSSRMEASLKKYVKEHYEDTKSDLFASFIIRCLELSKEQGLTGYMTPFVWMFIKRYQKLREGIIDNHLINNLVQLEYSGFEGATVPVCTFTLRKENLQQAEGSFIRLSDFVGAKVQAPKTLEAIQNPDCHWFYNAKQEDFRKIPRAPIGYWCSEKIFDIFKIKEKVKSELDTREGLTTADNDRFLRFWNEILYDKIKFNSKKNESIDNYKWFPYVKGGSFRKWYGNLEYIVNWYKGGFEVKNNIDEKTGRVRSHNYNGEYAFREGITWSGISSSSFSMRYVPEGLMFDTKGPMGFSSSYESLMHILSFMNSKVSSTLLKVLAPTLDYKLGHVLNLPLKKNNQSIGHLIQIAEKDWNSRETSWDFQQNELIRLYLVNGGRLLVPGEGETNTKHQSQITNHHVPTLKETYDIYKHYWTNKFFQLHQNEEELNRQFIEIYGLQDELTPDVPLDEITILQEELDSKKLKKLVTGDQWSVTGDQSQSTNHQPPTLPFKDKEVMAQFVSYAVGCMFGRYSLDKEGIILANQGETLEDYFEKVFGETHPSVPSQEGRFLHKLF